MLKTKATGMGGHRTNKIMICSAILRLGEQFVF